MPQNPGLSPEIMQAMQRRQQGQAPASPLQQQSPGAANANPMPQPMPQSQMTQASAPAGPPAGEAPKMPKFEPQDRIDLISMALIEQLKNDTKLQKEQGKMARGETQVPPAPQPTPQTPPQIQPVGGGGLSPGYEQPMAVNAMQSNYQGGVGQDYSGMSNYGQGGGMKGY